MDLNRMACKSIMDGIKRGMTIADFCEKYECSEEEFRRRLEFLYKYRSEHREDKFKRILDALEANKKKRKPRKITEAKGIETEEEADETVADNLEEEDDLETLKRLEEEQSSEIMELEGQHKELFSEHKKTIKSLRAISTEMERLRKEFSEKNTEAQGLINRDTELVQAMNDISAARREKVAILEKTRERIRELDILFLYVYDSGEITTANGSSIPEPESAKLTAMLEELSSVAGEECQELRLREITTLAKLLVFAKTQDKRVEVVCDSSELETAFRALY